MNGVKATKVITYVVMPGIFPRLKGLFTRGFGYIAFLMANVYNMVRILPAGHPYLNPANIGRYGIRHVIAEAANNIVVSRRNIDQVLIFIALLAAVILLLLQFVILIYGFIVHPASATSIFATPNPTAGGVTDVAFNLLDRVFGVPQLFCTIGNQCTTVMPGNNPWPFHVALHNMFQFYSLGLLLVGMLIFLYYVVVVIAETAISGTPFGKRFQDVWVPIRLVVAVGLLVPINYGLNSSQYIVLFAAKFGSGFATNTWNVFNDAVRTGTSGTTVFSPATSANPSGERASLLAKPVAPDISELVAFMSLVDACRYIHWRQDGIPDGNNPVVAPGTAATPVAPMARAYMVKNARPWMVDQTPSMALTATTTYAQALAFFNNSDILIRFGEQDANKYVNETSNVRPWCGEIRIHIVEVRNPVADIGASRIQRFYFELVRAMWFSASGPHQELAKLSDFMAEQHLYDEESGAIPWQCSNVLLYPMLPQPNACLKQMPNSRAKQDLINSYQALLDTIVTLTWINYNSNAASSPDMEFTPAMKDRGWAGAGVWYNKIAQINGTYTDAVSSVPSPELYPYVMEEVRKLKGSSDVNVTGLQMFEPNFEGDRKLDSSITQNVSEIARAMNDIFQYWRRDNTNQADSDMIATGRTFIDMVHVLFGTKGLFAMRGYNASVHPLAQLSSLGKGLVNSAIFSITGSAAAGGMAPLAQIIGLGGFSVGMDIVAKLFSSIAMIGLTAGLVLYYVLPFLPFLYFFFAVGTWVMTIFEAMVGAPLWALAHLRLDGEGLPGDSAINGYYLIFEIFLRPVLSIFGLVAAMLIFTAQVRVLHFIWPLVVGNVGGVEELSAAGNSGPGFGTNSSTGRIESPRTAIDQFFFTVIYTIIVYMMAIASFKLIDRIPDNILRFMGAGVSTFSDINQDPTEGLTRYAAFGGLTVGQQLAGAAEKGVGDLGGALAGVLGRGKGAPKG